MSTQTLTAVNPTKKSGSAAGSFKKLVGNRIGSAVALVIAVLWTVPTFGLFISSFRPESEIKSSGWWSIFADPQFTLENYQQVLQGSTSTNLAVFFQNSIVIAIPGTLAPLILAIMASYAFSVLEWKGRDIVFVAVFTLQIVPLQMALIPLLRIFSGTEVASMFPFLSLWTAHTIFGLPLAIFLLHNFMSEVPRDLIEAARIDGAGHVTVFLRVMLPLMLPAIASYAIFQFLWVWNDLLVGLTFSGGSRTVQPLTAALAAMTGDRGQDWHLLTAGAFISILLPLIVFFALQRFFVRGLLAGSVKG
ncbi:sugar ABC transporter permease [Microbacterium nanhaiense]|uniref:Sugar ABC transporter permease n=1 Tax=Microbacterium nanhaiense TaxID=1301026 RepID=A0ABQ2N393_9MICO|nr:carbohydrate ABC transporter permease [Microbacterium nanhaiense]GGO66886.1 sugar ABC transporter permease [Microbacterium nanhaiense]